MDLILFIFVFFSRNELARPVMGTIFLVVNTASQDKLKENRSFCILQYCILVSHEYALLNFCWVHQEYCSCVKVTFSYDM